MTGAFLVQSCVGENVRFQHLGVLNGSGGTSPANVLFDFRYGARDGHVRNVRYFRSDAYADSAGVFARYFTNGDRSEKPSGGVLYQNVVTGIGISAMRISADSVLVDGGFYSRGDVLPTPPDGVGKDAVFIYSGDTGHSDASNRPRGVTFDQVEFQYFRHGVTLASADSTIVNDCVFRNLKDDCVYEYTQNSSLGQSDGSIYTFNLCVQDSAEGDDGFELRGNNGTFTNNTIINAPSHSLVVGGSGTGDNSTGYDISQNLFYRGWDGAESHVYLLGDDTGADTTVDTFESNAYWEGGTETDSELFWVRNDQPAAADKYDWAGWQGLSYDTIGDFRDYFVSESTGRGCCGGLLYGSPFTDGTIAGSEQVCAGSCGSSASQVFFSSGAAPTEGYSFFHGKFTQDTAR